VPGVTCGATREERQCNLCLDVQPLRLQAFVTAAAWLLPPGSRDRYVEEFRAELYDLAPVGARWRVQFHYVDRQFIRAMPLTGAVRAPSRRRAVP
jgi:hypothetical protein